MRRSLDPLCRLSVGAVVLSVGMALLDMTEALAGRVAWQGLAPAMLLALLKLICVVPSRSLEGASMIVPNTPVALPRVAQARFDPVGFGLSMVVVVEMARLTPSVGSVSSCLRG